MTGAEPPSPGPSLADRATLLAYRSGWRVVRLLPERPAYRIFDAIADVAWWRQGRGVRQLQRNLRRARPDLDDRALQHLGREGMRSYLRYWCDAFRLPDWSAERLRGSVRVEGDARAREVLAEGRGVVMFLGHLGNWDHAGAWSSLELAPVTTVAERLRPEELFDRFLGFRRRLGMTILPLTGGSDVFRSLTRTLRQGGFVPLLADRDLSGGGVEVELLGEPARVAVGPAALALGTGAALFPVSIRYERRRGASPSGWGIVVTFHDEVSVAGPPPTGSADRREAVLALTQRCVDALSAAIRESPQDWHMLQRVFVADLRTRS